MKQPDEETLGDLLRRVHERLSGARTVDAESRRLLTDLTQDIESKLGSDARRARLGRDSLPRLEAFAVRFETEHPALGQGLRQLIDYLVKAGI